MTYDYRDTHCLVTGGGGFLGQTVVGELVDNDANVVVLDNFTFGATPESVPSGATVLKGDVRDPAAFRDLPDRRYDYCFHFASPSSVRLFEDNAHECTDITTRGFINAVNWCLDNEARLVYPSSGSLYAGVSPPHGEDSTLLSRSMNAYAKAKRSLELIHQSHNELDAVGLRIFAGYGPNEAQKGDFASVVTLFAQDILNGNPPVIYGDGTQKRDFVFETDVAGAVLTIGQKADEAVVNVGSGSPVSFNRLVDLINEQAGTNLEPEHISRPENYLERTEADTSLMKSYYTPSTTIEDGIAAVVDNLQ